MTVQSGLVTFHSNVVPMLVPIDSVTQHPSNWNNGDVEAIIESIEISGMYRPIFVQQSSGYIIAGNHTWLACKMLDAEQIPVVYLDVDDTTALRILVADNRIASLAQPDDSALVAVLNRLAETDSLMGTGYTTADHDALKALAQMPLDYEDFAQWPTMCFQVPPHVRQAFLRLTDVAGGDRERFELVLRLAGWDGKKPKGR